MPLFNGKNVNFYSDIPTFMNRVKGISWIFLIGFPLCEFLFAEFFHFYTANWLAVSGLTFLYLIFVILLYGHFFTKNQLSYLVSILGFIGNIFLIIRAIQGDFSALFLMQIGASFIFLTLLIDRIFYALVYLIPVSLTFIISLFFLDWSIENHVAYAVGMIILMAFFVINIGFKLFRLSILQFSEKVLNGYDKFVVVLNHRGDMVFVNSYAAESFGFNIKKDKYSDWWRIRGFSEEDTKQYKEHIIESIKKNDEIPVNEQMASLANGNKIIIKWSNQIIRGRFYVAIGSDISAEKKALSESQKLSKVTEALHAGVAIADENGNIQWCNKSYLGIFEYEAIEIIGRRPSEVFKVPEEFGTNFQGIIANKLSSGLPIEVPHYTKTGRLIWVLISASNLKGENGRQETIEVVTDITLQKNNELQFKQTSLIVERTQTPVILCDDRGTINWFNSALSSEFKDHSADVIGLSFFDKYVGRWTDREELDYFKKRLLQRESFQIDLLLNRQGVPQWYKLSIDPIKSELGGITQSMIIMQNIQHLKDAQDTIERKNKDILGSISYARRIQSALLPSSNFMMEHLPNHYIYYRPKDIVSGDFYYAKVHNGKIYFAIADCTGHGVPGAMITSIASSALNNAIFDLGLSEPHLILDHADKVMKETLSSETDELTDGMDIGLLVINPTENKVAFSGARRPLILQREGQEGLEIIPSVKRSIGEIFRTDQPIFKKEELDIVDGMTLCIFTDGVQDQFGGEKHKKIGVKRIFDLIESNKRGVQGFQEGLLEEFILKWTNNGKTAQTDDMLFGVVQLFKNK